MGAGNLLRPKANVRRLFEGCNLRHIALSACDHLFLMLTACRQRQALCAAHAHAMWFLCRLLEPKQLWSSGVAQRVAAQLPTLASGSPAGAVTAGIREIVALLFNSLADAEVGRCAMSGCQGRASLPAWLVPAVLQSTQHRFPTPSAWSHFLLLQEEAEHEFSAHMTVAAPASPRFAALLLNSSCFDDGRPAPTPTGSSPGDADSGEACSDEAGPLLTAVQGLIQAAQAASGGSTQLSAAAAELEGLLHPQEAGAGFEEQAWQAAAKLAAELAKYWEEPAQLAIDRMQYAQASGTRSCAFLHCGNLRASGGPAAGQGVGFKKCGGCRVQFYCSTQCSHEDWRVGHKRMCKLLAAMRGQAQAPSE